MAASSKNLRQYAKGKPCLVRIPGVCRHDTETVVLAHVRMPGVTGVGKKAPDLLGAWACAECHEYCERRYNDRDTRAFLEGVIRTQDRLIRDGVIKW